MDITTNLGLSLPSYDDVADIQVLNENFRKLDNLNAATYTFYVNGSVTTTGDGTSAKPFKTIAEAVTAGKKLGRYVSILVTAGTYNQAVTISNTPNIFWQIKRNGTGTLKIANVTAENVGGIVLENITFEHSDGGFISVVNVPAVRLNSCLVYSNSAAYGVVAECSNVFMMGGNIYNSDIAVLAKFGSRVALRDVGGGGNLTAINAVESVVMCSGYHALSGNINRDYASMVIIEANAEENTAPYFDVGCFRVNGDEDSIDTAVQFERMVNNRKVVYNLYGEHNLQNGSTSTYGLMRTAAPAVDDINCSCDDAAITPANLFKLSNYRLASTAYAVGAVVACPYHANFMLKCTKAGTTSATSLDTSGATNGKTYIDGGVTWTVIKAFNATDTIPIANGGTGATTKAAAQTNLGLNDAIVGLSVSGKTITYTQADGGTGTITTQDTNTTYTAGTGLSLSSNKFSLASAYSNPITGASISGKVITLTKADGTTTKLTTQDNGYHTGNASSIGGASATKPAVVVESYSNGYNWYRKYSDGWIEQGGRVPFTGKTVTLHKAMADNKYHINITTHTYVSHYTYDAVLYGSSYGETVTTTSFECFVENYGTDGTVMYRTWEVKGKGA